MTPARLQSFLASGPVVRVTLTRVRGSSPREVGATMFVTQTGLLGTIGGGQLEYMALDEARKLLKSSGKGAEMDVPLGPEIGQCCGGRVEIALTLMDDADKVAAVEKAQAETDALPHVYVFGAGHTGRAMADLFQHLPVACVLVDPRAEELQLNTAQVETVLTALPEAVICSAPPRSAFVVLTHDHALDFLLTSEALARRDAAYVGMIGSATKRASFESFVRKQCGPLSTDALVCPIGASGSRDKRPPVIAATVVAEVITALTSETAAVSPVKARF
ncbi:xanthine dehydrogenase accessory protein XdhC [Shimia biformata]|uniref:xanthine dehydrogenase accessory protein XdhC n=1 Tax=Shimia biformata TaxID=1294299 RepID=UPI0019504970|nr:xanthine dehydrogenase accessory protein XdhC [Shimia biformata]